MFSVILQISSSGNTSHSSVHRSTTRGLNSSRILYVNEKRPFRDKSGTARPRNVHKGNNSSSLFAFYCSVNVFFMILLFWFYFAWYT